VRSGPNRWFVTIQWCGCSKGASKREVSQKLSKYFRFTSADAGPRQRRQIDGTAIEAIDELRALAQCAVELVAELLQAHGRVIGF
jgi:hypothetical protein